jgi:membrane-associated PAP2 superfamily phosphatase
MNRTGLLIALVIGVCTGLVFGLFPQLDLALSAPFFDPNHLGFWARAHPHWLSGRWIGIWAPTAFAIAIVLVLVGKLLLPRRRMLLPGRAVLLLLSTLALAPGLVANVILKDNWGRPRPIDVTQFQGEEHFVAWWDPRGDCPKNCSFIAGEPSGAFWTLAAAAVTPPPWRALAYGLSLAFGAGVGLVRLAGGGHFVSDIIFSGVFTFLIVWLVHGLIYRWRATRITDQQVERAIERIVLPANEALERFLVRAGALLRRGGARERP